VDHTGSSSCPTSHDVLMATRVGVPSCLVAGLYSVEFKCREVVNKRAFPWEETLTQEARALWAAELAKQERQRRQGKILLSACVPRPCHAVALALALWPCDCGCGSSSVALSVAVALLR